MRSCRVSTFGLTLIGAAAHGELDLRALRGTSHHADDDVVRSAHDRLTVHRHNLVPGVKTTVHVRRPARYNVTNGHLDTKKRGNVTLREKREKMFNSSH
jgi:hypothetical protein